DESVKVGLWFGGERRAVLSAPTGIEHVVEFRCQRAVVAGGGRQLWQPSAARANLIGFGAPNGGGGNRYALASGLGQRQHLFESQRAGGKGGGPPVSARGGGGGS